MLLIRDVLQETMLKELGVWKKLTFCLSGYYPTSKGIVSHSDTVPTINDWVASCSLGGSRVFTWEQYDRDIRQSLIPLRHLS